MTNNTILYVAGKSGGHIIPALTLATHAKNNNNARILFCSTDAQLDQQLLKQQTIVDRTLYLPIGTTPRRFYVWPIFILRMIFSFFRTFILLVQEKPSAVISTGGYVALPVCLSAWLLRIPVELYELNVKPGKAIKFLQSFAASINICFPQAQAALSSNNCRIVVYPVRFNILVPRNQACHYLSINNQKRILLICGGSQGSRSINKLIQDWTTTLSQADKDQFYIIHQTGIHDVILMQEFYAQHQLTASVFGYRNDIEYCYAAADFIISRAGAGALFEILHFKKPALIIPLVTKTNMHQVDNAQAMAHNHPDLFTMLIPKNNQEDIHSLNTILKKALF